MAVAVAAERRGGAERPDVVGLREPVDGGVERVAQPLVEQHGRLGLVQPRGDGLGERVACRAARDEHHAGLRAQLAAEVRDGGDEAVGDRVGARGERGVGDHDRVDRAHLGVDRDRVRPRRGAVGDRAAARRRAGEADRGDRGRVDERLADLDAGGEQVGERPVGQSRLRRGGAQLVRDQLARARVRRMALDHDGAARGERGGGVPAGRAEREREVAGAEHRDRTDRDEHAADVRARDRRGVRVGGVDDRLDVVAGVEHAGERLELPGGALELAAQAAVGQPALAPGDARRSRRPRRAAVRRRRAGTPRGRPGRAAPDRGTRARPPRRRRRRRRASPRRSRRLPRRCGDRRS